MKVARYRRNDEDYYGAMEMQRLICLPVLAENEGVSLPNRIENFIEQQGAVETAEHLLREASAKSRETASVSIQEAELLAPIALPPKIVCLGWNYVDHAAERKVPKPEEPVFFMKPRTAIAGPGEAIVKRPFVGELDYEGELAIVIGTKAKDLAEAEALSCVFGYTILNDVSARDFQFKDKQWTRGKGFDTFAPIGPCITSKKQLPDTRNLNIRTWVNDELRQDGNTRDMIFTPSKIIQHLSRVMTLEPGDLIATGTPSGVAMAMKEPKWLKNGDTVKIEIEGIGALENTVKEA